METTEQSQNSKNEALPAKHYWFVFCNGDIMLLKKPDGSYTIPMLAEAPTATMPSTEILDVSPMDDGTQVKTYSIEIPLPPNSQYEMCGLRKSFYKLSKSLYLKAGKCEEILYWNRNNKYCGVCGTKMQMHTIISKKCPKCGKEVWPQLATAIIVLISKGDEVLLVHANNFKGTFYGLVAGFVETGETLEEAVRREVKEETSLNIKNIRYFASQPWPYPCGLMVGFFADYDSGEIHLQRSELGRGGWYHKDKLPEIPEKLSLARQLIDSWLEKKAEVEKH